MDFDDRFRSSVATHCDISKILVGSDISEDVVDILGDSEFKDQNFELLKNKQLEADLLDSKGKESMSDND